MNEPATKKDVEEIVGRVVGEIVSDALQMISERFDGVDQTLAEHSAALTEHTATLAQQTSTLAEHTGTLNRVDSALRASVARLDDHTESIEHLQQKVA